MQTSIGAQLTTHLQARNRKMSVVYELYSSDYQPGGSGFDPRDALETFAGISYTLPFGPVTYRREVLRGPSIKKTMGKEFNTASVRFSNVSRYMSDFVRNNHVEQMRLVIRAVARPVATAIGNDISVLSNTIVLFVGRCQKPDGFNRSTGTISAKPDMGTVEAQIPPRRFQASCPLEFKGPECLGTELLGAKSAAYQAAATCNYTLQQCTDYANTEFRQGVNLIQIESSFVHKSNESFFKKVLNIFPGVSRKKTTVNNSLYDGTPYGNPIPLIFGRWYKTLLPLQYQDIGTSINFLMAACRGKISDFINIKNMSLGFTQPIGVTKHLGEYGGEGSQTEDTVFPQGGFYSRLAYITGYCNGSDIETEEPAPEIAAVIAGTIPDQIYFDVDHDGTGKLSAGTGGVSAAGTSTSDPGTPAADFDTAITSRTPLSYVKLEDASGPTMTALVGVAGAYDALASFQEAGPIETDATSFGVGGRVGRLPASLGSALDIKGLNFTINGFGTTGALQTLVNRNGLEGQSGSNYVDMMGGGARISFYIDGTDYPLEGSLGVADGTYLMVTVVRTGALLEIYLNGCLANSRPDLPLSEIDYSPWDGYDPSNDDWKLGYSGPAGHVGEVWTADKSSHVSFYDHSWDAQDVADVYASAVDNPLGCPGEDWTDNPVDHARFILTEPALMGNDDDSIDDFLSAYAAAYNCGAIKDDTNAERCLLPNTETSKVGVDYKRYNSTGLLSPLSFQSTRTQIPAGVPALECDYEFYDPAAPPTSLDELIVYRKRFTYNIEFAEVNKAVDVLYDKIFPSFNGFLRWNNKGQTVIDSARPADWTSIRVASIVGATSITVQDVLPWKNLLGSPYLLQGKAHLDRRIFYVYDNAAIRTASTGFVAGDVGKYALQKDNNTIWKLTATTPTWLQITDLISEVRPVTAAVYSSLGDAITLASSASGGPTATASGANLTGGSTTVQSSGTVTITGSLTEDATITVTIDGIACVLTLLSGESSSIIGHRMACVINATPVVQEYVEAHASGNVVTIKAKIGVLTLASALEEAHDTQTEVTRVMASFAGKALTYADTTRANILDGTFEWPDASRQSLVNQIKAKYRESVRDFGEQPITVNDFNHQRKSRKTNPFEVDHSGIDNYNQSARLANGLLNKLRDGDLFFEWQSMGEPLLLDEGDVVCVSDDSGPFRNQLCRIEDIQISNDLEVTFNARKYSRLQLSDLVALPAALLLPSALVNFEQAPPDISFNEEDFPPNGLTQATTGTAGITSIRGGVIFGATIYTGGLYAIVKVIKRAGITVDEIINSDLRPNSFLEATFEFLASADGLYTVQIQACNQWGCSALVTADIVIGFGSQFVIAQEDGDAILQEDEDFLEQEH
jgi:hypothetical protein